MAHGLTRPITTNPHITHSRAVRGLIVLLQSQDCSGSLLVDPEIQTRSCALHLIQFQWCPSIIIQNRLSSLLSAWRRSHANGFLMEGVECGSHRRSYDPQIALASAMVEAIRKPRRSSGTTPFSASPTGASCSQSMQAPANRNGTGIRKSIEPFGPETRSSWGWSLAPWRLRLNYRRGALQIGPDVVTAVNSTEGFSRSLATSATLRISLLAA